MAKEAIEFMILVEVDTEEGVLHVGHSNGDTMPDRSSLTYPAAFLYLRKIADTFQAKYSLADEEIRKVSEILESKPVEPKFTKPNPWIDESSDE